MMMAYRAPVAMVDAFILAAVAESPLATAVVVVVMAIVAPVAATTTKAGDERTPAPKSKLLPRVFCLRGLHLRGCSNLCGTSCRGSSLGGCCFSVARDSCNSEKDSGHTEPQYT